MWTELLGAALPWSLAILVAVDVAAVLVTAWGLRSLSTASLASAGAAIPLFLWFGEPEAGPGAQLIATYKFALLTGLAWAGWARSLRNRWDWACALIPTTIASVLLVALFSPFLLGQP